MTKKRETASRSALAACLFVIAISSLLPVSASSRKERFWETVDVSEIVKGAKDFCKDAREPQCEELVRLNLKYIYFNFLAVDEFIAVPKPEVVAARISRVFERAERLRLRLEEGRRLCERDAEASELRQSARKIRQAAADVYGAFHNFFQEDHFAPYDVTLASLPGDRERFLYYIASCERIWNLFDEEMHHYFLNPSPGIAEVAHYQRCSIPVLTLSIRKLSELVEKSLTE